MSPIFHAFLLPILVATACGAEPIELVQKDNAQPDSLTFHINPGEGRFRYRLENFDLHWIEPTDEMNLSVRFLEADNNEVLRVNLPVTGTSRGWQQDYLKSPVLSRAETLAIPPGTSEVSFSLTSSGPPPALGIYLVRHLNAITTGDPGGPLLIDGKPLKPEHDRWHRSGLNPGMAIQAENTFLIEDNDLKAHADWELTPFPITGTELSLTWEEAYSIGVGGGEEVTYDRLPPGVHRLLVEKLDTAGFPTGEVHQLSVTVASPYWRTWWFWLLCLAFIALLATLLNRNLIRRRVQRALRHAKIIETERLRIAMDLHDDIGTRLSQISLVGSHAAMKATDEDSRESFQEINTLARKLVYGLSETVWTLNPKNNDLESLIGFLCRITSELCRHGSLRCRIDADPDISDIEITHDFRHHFLLSAKEALNNALRHSGGSEIRLTVKIIDHQLHVQVSDNGSGYLPAENSSGNGLESMKHRMQQLRGTFKLTHPDSGGLTVLLEAPIKYNSSHVPSKKDRRPR